MRSFLNYQHVMVSCHASVNALSPSQQPHEHALSMSNSSVKTAQEEVELYASFGGFVVGQVV